MKTPFGFKFEYWQSLVNGHYYFRLRARNNEIVAQSQGYSSLHGCLKGMAAVRRGAMFAKSVSLDES